MCLYHTSRIEQLARYTGNIQMHVHSPPSCVVPRQVPSFNRDAAIPHHMTTLWVRVVRTHDDHSLILTLYVEKNLHICISRTRLFQSRFYGSIV